MAISPQRLTVYLYSAHRAVIFAIAQLSRLFLRDDALATASLHLLLYITSTSIPYHTGRAVLPLIAEVDWAQCA